MNRINEITFNSSLIAELRAIEFVNRLIDQGRCRTAPGPTNTAASTCTASCSKASASASTSSSKLRNDYDFFELLRKPASARRGASSTRISTTSACARASIEVCAERS